jgi:hypothetical protein
VPSPFTIIQGKEGQAPKKPLFLVSITAPDGDACYLTTAAYYGAPNIVYGGNTYLARILGNEIDAIASMGPQGYDTVPGLTLSLADGDTALWTGHCIPHGWRGSAIVLTVILWDVPNNAYSTDAIQWTFIGGNPQYTAKTGVLTVDATSASNFSRLKVPSIPIQYRCPWSFPPDAAARLDGITNILSPYFQCGYAFGVGGPGNVNPATGVAFTTCDYTRSGGPPSGAGYNNTVGCMARMGRADSTGLLVAPDGDLGHDRAGHDTARFGGVTWIAPSNYRGYSYTSGQKVNGYNQPNTAIVGSYYNWVYGTQWVTCDVLAPANDPSSLRMECVVCFAPFGAANVLKVVCNGVEVPKSTFGTPGVFYDVLFNWSYVSAGGLNGQLNGDKIFDKHGDPHGSMCVIEVIVPSQLASGGAPTILALVTGGPTLAVNGGGFILQAPNLFDTGSTQPPNVAGPACNPVFAYLDLMSWGNVPESRIDVASFYASSLLMANSVSYIAADGSTKSHAAFKSSFQLAGSQRQSLAQVLTGIRNAANLLVSENGITGKIQCAVKQTLVDQQPAPIAGSNDSTPRASVHANGSAANGYYAYLFDESVIEAGSFRITSPKINAIPNVVAFGFQDEYNGYQTDSVTEIDPKSYKYSGNQQINVPIPMLGIANFDQATRQANVQLSEALYGNPRNDAGGTQFFEFVTNHRVLHLASQLGLICGLVYQPLAIGVSAPQAIRLLSVKPDTDGERWQVKGMWHNDAWYTTAYGQNPMPFQNNPFTAPVIRPPYPWAPDAALYGSGDALFPDKSTIQIDLDTSVYPAQVTLSGVLPINAQPSIQAPITPPQCSTGNSGGSIKPGIYSVSISVQDVIGPASLFATVNIPAGTNTNTIVVSNIQWKSGASPGWQAFAGNSSMHMRSATATGSSLDADGNPTVITITAISDGAGLPDTVANAVQVTQTGVATGGVWGDTIASVASGVNLTITGGQTVNQWAGYVLSLIYRPGVATQPALNMLITSNTASVLTMPSTGFLAGDVVVCRFKPGSITASTVGDANIANVFNGSGFAVDEFAGSMLMFIAGTGAGTPPSTIVSNTPTVFTINGPWAITPDATSVFIVIDPAPITTATAPPFNIDAFRGIIQVSNFQAASTTESYLLIQAAIVDVNGNASPMQYQPFRELYIPPQLISTSVPNPGYITVPLDGSNHFPIDIGNGGSGPPVYNFKLLLDTTTATGAPPNVATIATILKPIFTGGAIVAGMPKVTIFLVEDGTGGWPQPLFNLRLPMTNPGFESSLGTGWSLSPGPATISTAVFRNGLQSASDVTPNDIIYQDVTGLTNGVTYTVEAWLYTDAATAGFLTLNDSTGANIVTGPSMSPGATWVRVSLQYVANATGKVRIQLTHDATAGQIFWDDVSVYDASIGAYASDIGVIGINGTPNTRTAYTMSFHGDVWGLDSFTTGGATN